MTTTKIFYEKCFPLGGYSNEKIGIEVTIADGEQPVDGFAIAKQEVEKAHRFFQDLPKYEAAKSVMENEKDTTPRQKEQAQQVIDVFEANYPDYLQKFPVSRQLNAPNDELPY